MTHDCSIRLVSDRLVLRPTVPADVERALEIRADREVARNLASATIPPDRVKMTSWFAAHADEWRQGTAYRLAINLDSRLIGICDLFEVAEGEGEIGYWLDRAEEGPSSGRPRKLVLVLALVHQRASHEPRHHAAQLLAHFLDLALVRDLT